MVLERIISLKTAMRQPAWMFIIGGVVSTICLVISYFIFQSSIGLFTTMLITIAMMPFMVNLIRYDEAREEEIKGIEKMNIFQRHKDVLKVYIAFFGGMILCMSLLYILFPQELVEKIFNDQISEINAIRGNVAFFGNAEKILVNNTGVLALSFVFSFLFGAGAVFILAWNASVLAAAIGIAAKSIGGVKGLPVAIMIFFPHGSLEILAYFIGALAGGLVSTVVMRKKSPKFWFVIKDGLQLMVVAGVLLVIAAVVESMAMGL
jgi:uncharacterized membrane protein SpoIIM required for sporulation